MPVLCIRQGLEGRAGVSRVRAARCSIAQRHRGRRRRHDDGEAEGTGTRPRCAARAARTRRAQPATRSSRSSPIDELQPGKYQPRTRMDRDVARGARRVDQGAGRDAADPGAAASAAGATRSSPANAAGARRAWPGSTTVPALVREVPDEQALGIGADREHPARGPEPARRGAGLQRLIHEFELTHQAIAERLGRSRTGGHQPAAPARARAAGARAARGRRASTWATRARCSRCRWRARSSSRSRSPQQGPVGARSRAPGAAGAPKRPPAAREPRALDRDVARLEEEWPNRLGTTVQIKPRARRQGLGRDRLLEPRRARRTACKRLERS